MRDEDRVQDALDQQAEFIRAFVLNAQHRCSLPGGGGASTGERSHGVVVQIKSAISIRIGRVDLLPPDRSLRSERAEAADRAPLVPPFHSA